MANTPGRYGPWCRASTPTGMAWVRPVRVTLQRGPNRKAILRHVKSHAAPARSVSGYYSRTMRRADSRAACTAGSNSAIKMPMIVMTTSNSTSEKPAARSGTVPLCHDARCLNARHATATFSRRNCRRVEYVPMPPTRRTSPPAKHYRVKTEHRLCRLFAASLPRHGPQVTRW